MSSKSTTVSIIVPFYKGNCYLKRLIDSINTNLNTINSRKLNVNIEMIIVNDCPSDPVEYSNLDGAVFKTRVINHKTNKGIHRARITGLEESKGDFIIFLDQDDVLDKGAIASEIENIGFSDLIICNGYSENKHGGKTLIYSSLNQMNIANKLDSYLNSHNRIISPGQCMIRRNSIPAEWKMQVLKINGSDDLFLWILMLSKKCDVKILNKPVYIHKYTGENLSSSKNNMSVSTLEIAKYCKERKLLSDNEVRHLMRSRLFSLQWNQNGLQSKIIAIFKYPDSFIARSYWKLRSMI